MYFHVCRSFHVSHAEWLGMVAECELSLSRQASVLHPSHHITLNTLQHLIYACIGMCVGVSGRED